MGKRIISILMAAGLIFQGSVPALASDVDLESLQADAVGAEIAAEYDETSEEDLLIYDDVIAEDPGDNYYDETGMSIEDTGMDIFEDTGANLYEDDAMDLYEDAGEDVYEDAWDNEVRESETKASEARESETQEPEALEAETEEAETQETEENTESTPQLAADALYGSCGSNLQWSINTNGMILTISGSGAMAEYYCDTDSEYEEDDEFPWAQYRSSIEQIIIEDQVTTISPAAFWNCENVTDVYIGKQVREIGEQAFFWDTGLKTVNFGAYSKEEQDEAQLASLPELKIGDYAFDGCEELSILRLPKKTVSIGDGAFDNCLNLYITELGDCLKSIGECAFSGCDHLHSITIPKTLVSIGDNAFETCGSDLYFKIIFKGDFPAGSKRGSDIFWEDYVEIHYPANNETYTEDMLNDTEFSGAAEVKWIPMGSEVILEEKYSGYAAYGEGAPENANCKVDGKIKSEILVPDSTNTTWITGSVGSKRYRDGDINVDESWYTGQDGDYGVHGILTATTPGEYDVEVKTDDGASDKAKVLMKYRLPEVKNVKIAESSYTIWLSWDKVDFGPFMDGEVWSCSHGYQIEYSKSPAFPAGATEIMNVLPEQVDYKSPETAEEYCRYKIEHLEARTGYYVRIQAYATPVLADFPEWNEECGDYSESVYIEVGKRLARWSYHANNLTGNVNTDMSWNKTLMDADLPCAKIIKEAIDNGLEVETRGWEALKGAYDAVGDLDFSACEHKDIYAAILFAMLESESKKTDHGEIIAVGKMSNDLYDTASNLFKVYERIDLTSELGYWNLKPDVRMTIDYYMEESFLEDFHMDKIASFAGDAAKVAKTWDEVSTFYNNMLQIQLMCESRKQILKDMYNTSLNGYSTGDGDINSDLKEALQLCCDYMDGTKEDLIAYGAAELTKTGTSIVVGKFWDKLKENVAKGNPYIAGWWEACQVEFLLMDSLFGVSNIDEKYVEMKALVDVEALLRDVYLQKRAAYVDKQTEETAQGLIRTGDLLLNLYVMDCGYAINYAQACESGGLHKLLKSITKALGYETNAENMKRSLKSIRNSYMLQRYDFMTGWLHSLQADYPEEYDDYKHLFNDEALGTELHVHVFGSWETTKAPTCSQKGERVHYCEVCGEQETGKIDELPHTFVNAGVIVEPTIFMGGLTRAVCSVCGAETVLITPRLTAKAAGEKISDGTGTYEVTGGTQAKFCGPVGQGVAGVVIPESVKADGVDYTVTAIADNAFKGNKKLKTVTIPGTVEKIGNNAFSGCTALKKITIPASVTSIGSKAFYNCKKLLTIQIKTSKLASIGKNAFQKTGSSKYKKLKVTVPKAKLKAYKKKLKKAKLSKLAKIKKG